MGWYEKSVAIRAAWYELFGACDRYFSMDEKDWDAEFDVAIERMGVALTRLKELGVRHPGTVA